MAALPSAAPAVLLLNELRRLRERQVDSTAYATPPDADFVCDANGTVSNVQVASVAAITQTVQGQVLGTMVSTYVSVSDAALIVADATAQAATRAAGVTLDAASRAATSARDALTALHRQVTNADVIEQLRSETEVLAKFQGSKEWLDLMRALFAVGIAIAAADGEITESERQDIEDFVGGAGYSKLPAGLKHEIQAWQANPPSIERAFELACKCGEEGMTVIDNVMEVITQSDEVVHPAEVEFRQQWRALRKTVLA
jgi:hypothetical protein